MGEDRRGDHAEPDEEEGLVGDVVQALEVVVCPLVGRGELATAMFLGAGDPAEAGIEPGCPPRLGGGERGLLSGLVALLEHRDLVGSASPHEALLDRFLLGVGLEERRHLGLEVFDPDHGNRP